MTTGILGRRGESAHGVTGCVSVLNKGDVDVAPTRGDGQEVWDIGRFVHIVTLHCPQIVNVLLTGLFP